MHHGTPYASWRSLCLPASVAALNPDQEESAGDRGDGSEEKQARSREIREGARGDNGRGGNATTSRPLL